MRNRPKPCPRVAAKRVPLVRLPVLHQAIARATRPPSRGKAGTRLKISTSRLMLPSQAIRAASPDVSASPVVSAASRNSSVPASSSPAPAQSSTIRAVTIGPPIAILNSVEGESESPSRNATPPNIHRLIPEIPIP